MIMQITNHAMQINRCLHRNIDVRTFTRDAENLVALTVSLKVVVIVHSLSADCAQINCFIDSKMCEKKRLKIAIVGAGPSGLCCAKNALDYGHHVTVYEQHSNVGGTWIYTDQIQNDAFGLPIHSSMYKGVV